MEYSNIMRTTIFLILIIYTHELNVSVYDKVYVFQKDHLCIYGENFVPYKTTIDNIFLPPPNATVKEVIFSDPNIILITNNSYRWSYKRCKLREVVYSCNNEIKSNISLILFIVLFCLVK